MCFSRLPGRVPQGDLDGSVVLGAAKRAPTLGVRVIRDIRASRVDALAAGIAGGRHQFSRGPRSGSVVGELCRIGVVLAPSLVQLQVRVRTVHSFHMVQLLGGCDVHLELKGVLRFEERRRHARGGIDVAAAVEGRILVVEEKRVVASGSRRWEQHLVDGVFCTGTFVPEVQVLEDRGPVLGGGGRFRSRAVFCVTGRRRWKGKRGEG